MQTPYSPPGSITITPAAPPAPQPNKLIVGEAMIYGLGGGAALGALFGTCLFPVIGTLVGGAIGGVLGMIEGLINGLVLAALTAACFKPLINARTYCRTMRVVALLTTLLVALVVYCVLNVPLADGWGAMYSIPGLLAVGFGWWAAGRVARGYVEQHGAHLLPLPDPVGLAIYEPAFLQRLFDDMHSTYELVCTISSFGFGRRWRRQLIGLLDLQPGMRVLDLMSGSGETWTAILPRIGAAGSITAIDYSPVMSAAARTRRYRLSDHAITVLEQDALQPVLPSHSVDAVVCAYGVKTLSPADQTRFVDELLRVLRPGGSFGLVEISLPPTRLLRLPYVAYLSLVVPLLGSLLLGNPDSYRMLSRYLLAFDGGDHLHDCLSQRGCTLHRYAFFGGCATALVGLTPPQ